MRWAHCSTAFFRILRTHHLDSSRACFFHLGANGMDNERGRLSAIALIY